MRSLTLSQKNQKPRTINKNEKYGKSIVSKNGHEREMPSLGLAGNSHLHHFIARVIGGRIQLWTKQFC